MKRQNQLNIKRGLLSKLVLLAFFCISGVSIAEADTVIFDGSSDISGWTKSGFTYPSWASLPRELYASSSGTLTSNSKISLTAGQTFVISAAKRYSGKDMSANLSVKYKANLEDEWTDAKNFTDILPVYSSGHTDLVVDNIIGSYYLQIAATSDLSINTIYITDAPATDTPKLIVSSSTISFGTMRASGSETITVSNAGVGTMDVTISNSNTTDFTISTTSLTGIGEGESQTFDVTFKYNGESLGDKAATITVTPSYDEGAAKVISVTATAINANIWASFEDGIPSTWDNQNNSWLNYVSGFSGWANPGYMSSDYLRTPRLYAEAGQSIEFDVKYGGATASYKVKAEYSTDRINWTTIGTYTKTDEDIETKSFEAPAAGYYWLRFSAYQCGINNFTGWSIADNTHDVALGSKSIPTTAITHGEYTATVDVLERGGSGETLTAELYVDDVKVAEETDFTIGGNRDKTISLTYTPIETGTKQVYIKVYGENIDALETAKVNVTFNEPSFILDEESDTHPTSTVSTTIKLKYTAKAGWNTIVMPFVLTQAQLNTIFGPDNTVYVIKSCEDGTLTFTKETVYSVSMPYLVYAPNAVPNAEGIYLQNVAVYSYAWTWGNLTQTKGDATFQGTFTPIAAPGMNGKYGITDAGKLGKGNASASIKGYRAYLEVTNGELARIMTIDSEGETTDLGFVRMVDQETKGVYNLQGQKVEKGRKGIYIVNGKKVVIK